MTDPDNRAPECWSCRAGHPPTADQVQRAQTLIDGGTDAHGWAHVIEQAERPLTAARRGRTPPNRAELEYQYWRLRDLLGERDHAIDVAEERAEKAECEVKRLTGLLASYEGAARDPGGPEALGLAVGVAAMRGERDAARADGYQAGIAAAVNACEEYAHSLHSLYADLPSRENRRLGSERLEAVQRAAALIRERGEIGEVDDAD